MDAIAHHQPAPIQALRNRRGRLIGRLEQQHAAGKIVACDARGLLVVVYESRTNTTRDAQGCLIGFGYQLPALLAR
ncbi:hypothetical protein FV228_15805 [Methylobacterium sp. WL18]|uniref:hypothetical protein n=1 Tax=Methylobacterium sp. WL18 TaxID=2603897 RepID=UPI0011C7F908|nr:hypothetical protein [Methylobacterium sp. WL18]TXN65371.1 hypothetical protein FV228_15805 [Methylobacterium sp. WL18]